MLKTLGAALLLAAATLSAADPSLVNLVMPDATALAGIDIERARTTPFGQYVLAAFAREDRRLSRFIEATGFDPRRHIREVLVASNAADRSALLLLKGTFDADQLARVLERLGGVKQDHSGVTLIVSKRGNEAVALLDSTTAIGGHPDAVRAAIDRRSSATILKPALAVKINELSTGQHAWVIADDLTKFTGSMKLNGPVNVEAVRKVTQASAAVQFGTIVQVTAEATAVTAQDASALADVIRFLAQFALMRNNDPEAAAVLQTLKVSAQDTKVNLSLSIPEQQIERIFRPQQRRPQARPAAYRQ
jgi:hypothetical protein